MTAWLESGWRFLALPLWLVYEPLVRLHHLAYDRGWRRARQLPAPVICIGNLSSGGTGKTPLVETCCELLRELGRRPAVLSRGYHGRAGRNDEAELLAAPVFCDAERYRAGQAAIAAGADVLLMDDGFQHRRLRRDLDLVCIDSSRSPPAWHRTLPLGLYREGPRALRRAGLLVLTRCDQGDTGPGTALAREFGLPLLHCRHEAIGLRRLPDEAPLPLAQLRGERLWLASGIGHPAAFRRSAEACGVCVAGETRFADHHHYTTAELLTLANRCRTAAAGLLITSKDAVKWLPLLATMAAPPSCWVLEVRAVFAPDELQRLRGRLAELLEAGTQVS